MTAHGSWRAGRALLLLAGALAAAGVVLFLLWSNRGTDPRGLEPDAAREAQQSPQDPALLERFAAAPSEARDPATGQATGLPAGAGAGAAVKAATPASSATRGRVLDLQGARVAGVPLAPLGRPLEVLATSAADGTFDIESAHEELESASPSWIVVRQSEPFDRGAGSEMFVIVARAIELAGAVVDEASLGLLGAEVRVRLPDAAFARFPELLDRALAARERATTTDAGGRFALVAPGMEGALLEASLTGHAPSSQVAPSEPRANLVIVMRRAAADRDSSDPSVQGRVVHHDGTPGAGATVTFVEASTTADEGGRFMLAVPRGFEAGRPLVATKRGFQAAVIDDFARQYSPLSPSEVVLTLGPPPLSIAGLVVDAQGKPLAGWTVQLVDGTLIEDTLPPVIAESLTFGSDLVSLTAADGAFALGGLLDRTYRLQAHSAAELLRVEAGPFAAGARDVRIVVPADAQIARVAGQVVGLDGTPIEHVRVRVRLEVMRTMNATSHVHSADAWTDAEGRFELVNLPRERGAIDVDGDAILPETFDYAQVDVSKPLILQVERRCHFRVEGLSAETGVTGFSLSDANGAPVAIWRFYGGAWLRATTYPREDASTAQLAASETARTIHFRGAGDQELGTRALQLVPGQVTVVRY